MSGDPGLQPERTSLAWRRTGLGAVAAAVALVRVALLRGSPTIAALCAALVVVAVGAGVEGSRRHGQRRSWFESDDAVRGLSLAARAAVVLVAGLGVAGLLLVLTT